ncbi:MAG: Hsp20 family protein [Hyphomicrobium sp.]|nr:Hsp20 family protein [Hyphomicrobium sp.]
MRHVDFSPFYRTAIGFDRLVQMLDQASGFDAEGAYPPYNIERTGENAYRISLAVAGFSASELKIDVKEQTLVVSGAKSAETTDKSYLHRGIAARAFERRYQLADYVDVTGAAFENGLLHVDLVRNLPERMKPRSIAIGHSSGHQRIEATGTVEAAA